MGTWGRVVIVVAGLGTGALAQAMQSEPAPIVQRRVIINFDDEVIESGTQAPLLIMQTARRRSGHPSVIRVRAHFKRDVLLSARDL